MQIRQAQASDTDAILDIVAPVIRAGETYAIAPDLTREEIAAYWLGDDKLTLVAVDDGDIVGTYYIKTNQGGGGSHVCNCGYMTAPWASGRGIARQMCEDSLIRAKDLGYTAMQFNFVIASNAAALHLWPKLGFEIVGRLPGAFIHPTQGETDALVMYRKL